MKYLLQFKMLYCDEFMVKGFDIVTEEEYKEFLELKEQLKNVDDTIYIGFGSNEELEATINEFLDSIYVEEISDMDAQVIGKYFYTYGLVNPKRIIKELKEYNDNI